MEIINRLIVYNLVSHDQYNHHFLLNFTILLNPAIIFFLAFDVYKTFTFIDYHLYYAGDVAYLVTLLVANLMLWMPIAFAIQMYAIRKYRKRNSKKLVSMNIPGIAIRIVAITVIVLTYIWFIWYA